MARGILFTAAAASLALTACGKPSWMDPAKADAQPQPPFLLDGAQPAQPIRIPVTSKSVPPPPAWAEDVLGKTLDQAYPGKGACLGNTDSVAERYEGERPGRKLLGWGWDPAEKRRIERVVLVDADQRIIGVGEGGEPRPDVTAALSDVPDQSTGWSANVARTEGFVSTYGVLANGAATCVLGRIALQ